MLKRATLSGEHDELSALADGILDQLATDPPDYEALGTLRWRLNRVLLLHLAKEDKLLYPRLSQHVSVEARRVAERFAVEMGGLAAAFTAYIMDWPIERAQRDWPVFATKTREVLAALQHRIRREERELYPLID